MEAERPEPGSTPASGSAAVPALISTIIPTYNRAAALERAIGHVVAQTWRPIQLIVVNDGSSDETRATLDKIENSVRDAGVEPTFIHQKNEGVASARNAGLLKVRGSHIAFLDDDDEWYPDKLERQMGALAADSIDACCCLLDQERNGDKGCTFPIDASRLITGDGASRYVAGKAQASLISLLVKAEFAHDVGNFDTDLKIGEDVHWIARLVHGASFAALPEALGRYTYSEQSLSRVSGYESLIGTDVYERLLLLKIRESCRHYKSWDEEAWRGRAAQAFDQFIKHRLYGGELTEARKLYDEAVKLTDGADPLPRTKSKLRKARWLALFGRRIKHPKFDSLEEIRS